MILLWLNNAQFCCTALRRSTCFGPWTCIRYVRLDSLHPQVWQSTLRSLWLPNSRPSEDTVLRQLRWQSIQKSITQLPLSWPGQLWLRAWRTSTLPPTEPSMYCRACHRSGSFLVGKLSSLFKLSLSDPSVIFCIQSFSLFALAPWALRPGLSRCLSSKTINFLHTWYYLISRVHCILWDDSNGKEVLLRPQCRFWIWAM